MVMMMMMMMWCVLCATCATVFGTAVGPSDSAPDDGRLSACVCVCKINRELLLADEYDRGCSLF
jgi:hypothetical protein